MSINESNLYSATIEELIKEGFKEHRGVFAPVDEHSFTHTDLSDLSTIQYTKEDALDFIYSPEKMNQRYSSNEVLGILEGIFFMPDGFSRNRRFYSNELWTTALESVDLKGKLQSGMLGMFEHPTVSQSETKDGLMTTAHPLNGGVITKELKIIESNGKKYGIGKAYILNNAVGNAINVLLKAKDENGKPLMKLAVSSRAWARSKGKDKKGNEILDPKFYRLETFDIVMNPGIAEAFPEYRVVGEAICNSVSCGVECEAQIKESLIKDLNLKIIGA